MNVLLEMSCAFATSMESHEHARCAEQLGYRRAYFYDSPALYADVWVQLCRAAERTERIILGPAVLVPSNRHVVTNAAAICTLAGIAGSQRVSVAIGSGRTARLGVGKPPLKWSDVGDYARALKGLLRGAVVDWDGARVKLLQQPGFGATPPLDIEILIAAAGPKGLAVAQDVADGIFGGLSLGPDLSGFARTPCMTWGTVLDEDEAPDSDRAIACTGGVAAVFAGHYPIDLGDPEDDSPTVALWRDAYADSPPGERHLAVHTGHLTHLSERDRPFITAEMLVTAGLALTRSGWQDKLADLESRGASEVVYQPSGPDIPAELDRFSQLFAGRS